MKGAFDLWWEWAQKPHESFLMIDVDIHHPIMSFRQKIGATARRSMKLCADIKKVGSAVPERCRPPGDHVHAADSRARGDLEFAWALMPFFNPQPTTSRSRPPI